MPNNLLYIDYRGKNPNGFLKISGSKSESNRWLILQQFWKNLAIDNLSDAEDTQLLKVALNSNIGVIDIHHAGTAMRFLTAYFAVIEGKEILLTGSARMKNRPIGNLVKALNRLGASITYLEKEGFPPLKIKGQNLFNNKITLEGNISSQYSSALLLIAPILPNGLRLNFSTEITSRPYLEMTISQLKDLGVSVYWEDNNIIVEPFLDDKNKQLEVVVESDWSSASYFYSLLALSKEGKITLKSFKEKSNQGDAVLRNYYQQFGIKTTYINNEIQLSKQLDFRLPYTLNFDLKDTPDIAQTIAVTCIGLGIDCFLSGLKTLKIKETDRLTALKTELEKLGGQVEITDDSLQLKSPQKLNEKIIIETYNDHRMAMAFAPLSLKTPIYITDKEVVKKSYPNFWSDLNQLLK